MTRIDAVFDAERAINGLVAGARLAVRQAEVAPLGEAEDKAFLRHYSSLPENARRTIRDMADLLSKQPGDK